MILKFNDSSRQAAVFFLLMNLKNQTSRTILKFILLIKRAYLMYSILFCTTLYMFKIFVS